MGAVSTVALLCPSLTRRWGSGAPGGPTRGKSRAPARRALQRRGGAEPRETGNGAPTQTPTQTSEGPGGPGVVVRDRRDLGASAGALGSSAGVIPQVLKASRFLRFYRPSLELKK